MIRLATLALGAVLLPSPAPAKHDAMMVCGSREPVVAEITGRYGETLRAVANGEKPAGAVVEVYASAETGRWTILISNARGRSCIYGKGHGFVALEPAAPAEAP